MSAELFDWVIVGGGPHGVCAGRALAESGATVRIVEPSGQLLGRWQARARSVDMKWMRSPAMHHLAAQPVSLHHFLHRKEHADVKELAGMWKRPLHEAFLRHSWEVIDEAGLKNAVVRGRVASVREDAGGLIVLGDDVELRGRQVLLATGSNQPRVPEWSHALRVEGAPIHHAFEEQVPVHHDLLGGGISAVQRALMISRGTGRTVRIWMRRPVTVADFDFDRLWTKHRFLAEWGERDEPNRLDFLARNRSRGSVPEGLARRLARAVKRGSIEVILGEPSFEWNGAAERLVIKSGGRTVESTGLTLMTGLMPETLGGWMADLAEGLQLPQVAGLPRLDSRMEWGRGIHLSGGLARLSLGPMAANLIGARWATSRLPRVRMQAA